jgi:heterodisulfide reductase subunit C
VVVGNTSNVVVCVCVREEAGLFRDVMSPDEHNSVKVEYALNRYYQWECIYCMQCRHECSY